MSETQLLVPRHKLSHNNPIVLANEQSQINLPSSIWAGQCKLQLQWTPQCQVVFKMHGSFSGHPAVEATGDLLLPGMRMPFAFAKRQYADHSNAFIFRGKFLGQRLLRISNPLLRNFYRPSNQAVNLRVTEVHFYVPNWISFIGHPLLNSTSAWAGGFKVGLEGFSLELQSFSDSDQIFSNLRAVGGNAITHQGQLIIAGCFPKRIDEVHAAMARLHSVFSFLRGSWTGPLLGEYRLWGWAMAEELSPMKLNSWKATHRPLGESSVETLQKGVQCLFTMLGHTDWASPLEQAITWYVESSTQSGGIESGIVLTQVAFELLAWVRFVEIEKTVTSNDFRNPRNYPAAQKIRMLLQAARIPLAIPNDFTELRKHAASENWTDGPQAITVMRNALVHAEQRHRVFGIEPTLRIQAWKLGLHYLELLILHVARYKGPYYSRVTQNEVPVPW